MMSLASYDSYQVVLSYLVGLYVLHNLFLTVLEILARLTILITILFILYFIISRDLKAESLKAEFNKEAMLMKDVIVFPEKVLVEIGTMKIKHYALVDAGIHSVFKTDIVVANAITTETRELRLSELCDHPFYVYAERRVHFFIERLGEMYVSAPGFVVKSGRFKNIIGLCLNTEAISSRKLELKIVDPLNEGLGIVELDGNSIKAATSWVVKTPLTHKVVYDRETGVYRVEARPLEKTNTRGVMLEACFPTASQHKCIVLSSTKTPNTTSTGGLTWRVKNKLLFVHRIGIATNLFLELQRSLESSKQGDITIAGYTPGEIRVKLVVERSMRRDLVQESIL